MLNFICSLLLLLGTVYNSAPIRVDNTYTKQNKLYIKYTNVQNKEILNVYFKVLFVDKNDNVVRIGVFKYQTSKKVKADKTQTASWVDLESTTDTVDWVASPVYVLFADGTQWKQEN